MYFAGDPIQPIADGQWQDEERPGSCVRSMDFIWSLTQSDDAHVYILQRGKTWRRVEMGLKVLGVLSESTWQRGDAGGRSNDLSWVTCKELDRVS